MRSNYHCNKKDIQYITKSKVITYQFPQGTVVSAILTLIPFMKTSTNQPTNFQALSHLTWINNHSFHYNFNTGVFYFDRNINPSISYNLKSIGKLTKQVNLTLDI